MLLKSHSTKITALHAASHCGQLEIIDLLCSAGARVNSKDSKCLSPLHYACRSKNEVNYYFAVLTLSLSHLHYFVP